MFKTQTFVSKKKFFLFFFDDTLLNQWHVAPALSPCSLYWPLWLSRCRLLTKVTAHAKWICLDFHQQPVTLLGAYFSTAFAEVLFILVTVSHHKDALKTGFQNQCFVFIQSWFFTSVLGDLIKNDTFTVGLNTYDFSQNVFLNWTVKVSLKHGVGRHQHSSPVFQTFIYLFLNIEPLGNFRFLWFFSVTMNTLVFWE